MALDADFGKRIEREVALLRPTRLTPEAVPESRAPAAGDYWIPKDMVPLWGTQEYANLSETQQRRYNQYYALQKAESFIWTEHNLIIAPLEKLLAGRIPSADLRRLLESFVADEKLHVQSIGRLLKLARPDLYETDRLLFFVPSRKFRFITGIMTSLPRYLSSWALLICALEENTIAIAQGYRQAGAAVDGLFSDVYLLHAQDEARHCKLDTLLCEWLIAGQAGLRKEINARMLYLAFKAYFDPEWGLDKPIKQLIADYPELRDRESALMSRTRDMRAPSFASILLDGSVAPLTAKNAERFDMLANAIYRLASPPGTAA